MQLPELPEPDNEAFRTFFRDQLLALLQSNPHGVQAGHVFIALRPYGYVNAMGVQRELMFTDVVNELARLHKMGALEGRMSFSTCIDPRAVWKAKPHLEWDAFDELVMGMSDG